MRLAKFNVQQKPSTEKPPIYPPPPLLVPDSDKNFRGFLVFFYFRK